MWQQGGTEYVVVAFHVDLCYVTLLGATVCIFHNRGEMEPEFMIHHNQFTQLLPVFLIEMMMPSDHPSAHTKPRNQPSENSPPISQYTSFCEKGENFVHTAECTLEVLYLC